MRLLPFVIAISLMIRSASGQAGSCVVVENDRIVAGELATALPAFSLIAQDTALAPAPVPGARRTLHGYEIASLAKRFSIDLVSPSDVCFERQTEPLDRQRVLEAMHEALGIPNARIEILETSLWPVPKGVIEFRREGLHKPATDKGPQEWRGHVAYGAGQRFSIWARVTVSAPLEYVVAAEALKVGEPIAAAQIRVETRETFPLRGDLAEAADQVVGKLPWRPIAKDSVISLAGLKPAMDVNRGDTVEVEIRSGAARLALSAMAEAGGRTGDTIAIRNPINKNLFRARIVGKGKVFLDVSSPI